MTWRGLFVLRTVTYPSAVFGGSAWKVPTAQLTVLSSVGYDWSDMPSGGGWGGQLHDRHLCPSATLEEGPDHRVGNASWSENMIWAAVPAMLVWSSSLSLRELEVPCGQQVI